jgi:hypothetical protein
MLRNLNEASRLKRRRFAANEILRLLAQDDTYFMSLNSG